MITVRDVESTLYNWAPSGLAASWDNVGLLVGAPDREVKKILTTLDITESVVDEAVQTGADLIVAHHPVMNCTWHPVQTLRTDDRQGRILTGLVENHISAICMHTNLDAADGGVNDALAEKLGLLQTEYLTDEKIGRVGTLKCQIPLVEFTRFVVKSLGCNGLRYTDCGRPVHRVAVGGGACGEYIAQAIALGCDTFVTSDLRYHDFLDTKELNLIDAGHFPRNRSLFRSCAGGCRRHFPQFPFPLRSRIKVRSSNTAFEGESKLCPDIPSGTIFKKQRGRLTPSAALPLPRSPRRSSWR